ncbi:MAG: hypothetical protein C1943_12245 [Halochromatium sp.]|nr:hypothetical protein [Halochromatium sp.]
MFFTKTLTGLKQLGTFFYLVVVLILGNTAAWAPLAHSSEQKAVSDTGADLEARTREQSSEEDPLTIRQQEATETLPAVQRKEPNHAKVYGSLRVRYRGSDTQHGFSDGGSRLGIDGRYQFLPGKWIFARGEAGFNLLDEVKTLFNGGGNAEDPDGGRGDTFFRRLLYAGYESPNLFVVFGKTWSTYYKVTSFTDRFFGTGGKAAGTYNAGTDGGYTGTGRADNAFQTRLMVDFLPERWGLEPFQLNLQLQDGEPIPQIDGQRYGHGLGLSALLVTSTDFSLGIAYNHAQVRNDQDPVLRSRGLDGNATALALGARWFDDDWYLATVVARLQNQMTTDQGNYFDGVGWELYGQHRLGGKWWLTGGWNWLRPDGDQPLAGDYRVKFAVLGLRYALQDFDRVLYANLRDDRSLTADGSGTGNVLTIGLRWAL